MDIDERELEQEQLDYIKRTQGDISVPDYTNEFPDRFKKNEKSVVLDKEQEEKIISEIRSLIPMKIKEDVKPRAKFTIGSFLAIISSSFVGIMDDLLDFDGNIEDISEIFTKEDRMVFVGTLIVILSLFLLTR